MCGINGIISLHGTFEGIVEESLKSQVDTMNECLVHRGPDSKGKHVQNPIAFGFRRLSIIDLNHSANQPMFSENGNLVLVFNGEIFNYLEIKKELIAKGHHFETSSDTEVILKSYVEYGDNCVEHFNGMWAFAIYDFHKKRLFCSRDRLGVKPFYYTQQGTKLFFSSELKALSKITGNKLANRKRVYEYLAYGYRLNNGETFFDNFSELLPGTNLLVEDNQLILKKYWTLKSNQYTHDNKNDYKTEFLELFKSAVKLRYRSDVPVALLLSGGLDSTAIARVTDDLIEKGELDANEIHAFIASFPGYVEDETEIAREFTKTCKHIKLHEISIDPKKIFSDFEKLIYELDSPLGSFNCVAHNNIMKECHKRGIKVVLNGQASDEAFAGYDRYFCGVFLVDQLLLRKGSFIKEFRALNRKNGYSKKYLFMQMFKALISPSTSAYIRARFLEKTIPVLDKQFVKQNRQKIKSDYKFSMKGDNLSTFHLDRINNQGLNTILHYEDISSMNQSIEIRSPFVDYRLMEFAFSIPTELKFKEGVTKIIIKDTVGKLLPEIITKNRNKIGFTTPFDNYLVSDTDFKKFVDDMLSSNSFKTKNIWDSGKLAEIFKEPKKSPNFPFWRVINLEVWSKVYNISNL